MPAEKDARDDTPVVISPWWLREHPSLTPRTIRYRLVTTRMRVEGYNKGEGMTLPCGKQEENHEKLMVNFTTILQYKEKGTAGYLMFCH